MTNKSPSPIGNFTKGALINDRYILEYQLAHDPFTYTFLAIDTNRFSKSVRIKVHFKPEKENENKFLPLNFLEYQAKLQTTIQHDFFPTLIDFYKSENFSYIVTDYESGVLLSEIVGKKEQYSIGEVFNWIHQILDALSYLHNLTPPVIIRNLNLSNLFVTKNRKLKLNDISIAKTLKEDPSQSEEDQAAAFLNNSSAEEIFKVLDPTFLGFILERFSTKPEIENCLKPSDCRTDIYCLGATIYQLLTDTLPNDALKRLLNKCSDKDDPLPQPISINSDIPYFLNSIILKALEIDRNDRFTSVKQMSEVFNYFYGRQIS